MRIYAFPSRLISAPVLALSRASASRCRASSCENSPAAYLVISHFPDGAGESDLFADGGGHVADRLGEARHICEPKEVSRYASN
jgi:hypothetical protein